MDVDRYARTFRASVVLALSDRRLVFCGLWYWGGLVVGQAWHGRHGGGCHVIPVADVFDRVFFGSNSGGVCAVPQLSVGTRCFLSVAGDSCQAQWPHSGINPD